MATEMIFEDGWEEIKDKAIDPLIEMLEEGIKRNPFTNKEYMQTYTVCYNMCTQKSNWSADLYRKHHETISNYLENRVVPSLTNRYDNYLLRELVRRWRNHEIMNKWFKKFFTYLDRFFVGYNSEKPLLEKGVFLFKSIVYDQVKKDASAAIISLIDQERDNSQIDRDLVKSCVEIFEAMGMGSIETYESDLEAPLIESTRIYYQRFSDDCILDDSTPVYLIRVEKILNDEQNRIHSYLNLITEQNLFPVLETVLIESKLTQLLEKEGSGLQILLQNDREEDIIRMYQLFSRLKSGLGVTMMSDILREHIIQKGNDCLAERKVKLDTFQQQQQKEKEATAPSSSKEKGGEKGDKEKALSTPEKDLYQIDIHYLQELLFIHEKYLTFIKSHLQNNSSFHKALKDSYTQLLNRDMTKINHIQIINTFLDNILKINSYEKITTESEIEVYLERIVQLFSYLTDKDMFNEIYRNLLAKRLLSQRSSSDEMERLMISKLKLRCGSQFTSKMEGMLTDLSIANDHQTQFEKYYKDRGIVLGVSDTVSSGSGIEFTVQVLTTGYWPTYKVYDINLPASMDHCCKVFSNFYDTETSKRKLQWIFSQGEATIKAIFPSRSYEIQLTTVQAALLLAFSSASNATTPISLSYETLMATSQLPDEAVKRVMHSLACGKIKILKKDNPSSSIKNTDVFSCNEKFSSKSLRFRIPIAIVDDSHNPKKLEEDRGHTIEASIVRIMKARKILSHQQLIAEVLTQLSFFRPDVKKVRRHVEALIEREYLERDENNRDVYKYLA